LKSLALIEELADAPGVGRKSAGTSGPSRSRRLLGGWSANLLQLILGITQQIALVPVFLQFWTSEVLAAWLVIYAVGNLVMVADSGLQFRAINRFLAFKSSADCDDRTARFYAAILRIYLGLAGCLVVLLLIGAQFLSPSAVFGFKSVAGFDTAFIVMAAGMLTTLPANLVTALYRVHGLYGRAVRLQNQGMLFAQLIQLVAIVVTGSLLIVTIAYVVTQLFLMVYLVAIDAHRLFPFLRGIRAKPSWRWIIGQFRLAFPFAVAVITETALQNLPVLLVSIFVSDRLAVAQWGLTRVAAGLLRALCIQTTLPLASELGHDFAVGLRDQLRRLYARGSVFVTLLASVMVSGLLPFWQDFFALWTHGTVPYDAPLTITLLVGAVAVSPSVLALGYANFSDRGALLVRTKGLQLAAFLVLSTALIPPLGPLGAAIAIVTSDLFIQFGLLGVTVIRQTLSQPFRHIAFLVGVIVIVTLCGWGLGTVIRSVLPWTGLFRFFIECGVWLAIMTIVASPLVNARIRDGLVARIPK
jgi:O-antigen/teichoic acid export membrane protein